MIYPGSVVKTTILEILAEEPSLNAKQLHTRISKILHEPISHQALYKALKKMVMEGVIAKHNGTYCLSPMYIENLKQIVAAVSSGEQEFEYFDYLLLEIHRGEQIRKEFKACFPALNYLRDVAMAIALNMKEPVPVYKFLSTLPSLLLPQNFDTLKFCREHHFSVTTYFYSSTPMDFCAADQLAQMGEKTIHVQAKQLDDINTEFIIFGEYVIALRLPERDIQQEVSLLKQMEIDKFPTQEYVAHFERDKEDERYIVTVEKNEKRAIELVEKLHLLK